MNYILLISALILLLPGKSIASSGQMPETESLRNEKRQHHGVSDDQMAEILTKAAQNGFVEQQKQLLQYLEVGDVKTDRRAYSSEPVLKEAFVQGLDGIFRAMVPFKKGVNESGVIRVNLPELITSTNRFIEQLEDFKACLPLFNKPGFLLTSVQPKYTIADPTSSEPFIAKFKFLNQNYVCVGRENVRAAGKLIPILGRLTLHLELKTMMTLTARIAHSEELLRSLYLAHKTLEAITLDVIKNIETQAPRRNRIFAESIGLK